MVRKISPAIFLLPISDEKEESSMLQLRRILTSKEQQIVDALERQSPGTGTIVAANLTKPKSDWAETIQPMTVEEAVETLQFVIATHQQCQTPKN